MASKDKINDNILEYDGYQAEITLNIKESYIIGTVLHIDDKIVFEVDDIKNAEQIFRDTINDYKEMCKEINQEPCRPYKGRFNVRISPELHKQAVMKSKKENISLNTFVEQAIQSRVDGGSDNKTITENKVVNIYITNTETKQKNKCYNFEDFETKFVPKGNASVWGH